MPRGVQEDRRRSTPTSVRTPRTDWYPHYIHNLDNLIRFGGLYPPIQVHADLRRTVLLGATQVLTKAAL